MKSRTGDKFYLTVVIAYIATESIPAVFTALVSARYIATEWLPVKDGITVLDWIGLSLGIAYLIWFCRTMHLALIAERP
jgi:hypothetical protein